MREGMVFRWFWRYVMAIIGRFDVYFLEYGVFSRRICAFCFFCEHGIRFAWNFVRFSFLFLSLWTLLERNFAATRGFGCEFWRERDEKRRNMAGFMKPAAGWMSFADFYYWILNSDGFFAATGFFIILLMEKCGFLLRQIICVGYLCIEFCGFCIFCS